MVMSIILWITIIWMPVLMYFMLRNETRFKKNIAVGVTFPQEARDNAEIQAALSGFKREELWICIGLITAAVPCMLIPDFGVMFIIWFIWVDISIVLPYIPYIRCYKKLRRIKAEHGWNPEKHTHTGNISAASMSVRWMSSLHFLLPFAFSLFPLIYERELWVMYLLDAVMVVLCFLGYRYLYRNKAETVDDNLAVTEALTRIRRYNWGKCWLWCAWMMAAINISTSLLMDEPIGMLIFVLILASAIMTAIIGVEFRTRHMQEKLTAESGIDFYVDDDDLWIWGMFYYNPNDSHLIVNQRVGINTTVNLARRSGKIFAGLIIILLLGMPLIGVWFEIEEAQPVTIILTEDMITAEHSGDSYEIQRSQITEVTVLEELPKISRIWGTGMSSVQKGTYSSPWGSLTACLDPRTGPWIFIKTTGGKYLIGSSEGITAEEIAELN